MTSFQNKKSVLRKEIRTLLKMMDESKRADESRLLCHELISYLKSRHLEKSKIGVFSPLPYEPDLSGLHDDLSDAALYYPLCGEGNTLTMHPIKFPESELSPGMLGILEPVDRHSFILPGLLDVILVPGLAFTPKGARLGKGGGYYDRLLSDKQVSALKIGIGFECQLVDEIPMEPHDCPMDKVICGGK